MSKHENHSHKETYLKVWAGLLFLTVVTVIVSYFNFGVFNILVAMGVATVKASLVCLFFMHLIDDNKINRVIFLSSFVFLFIFIALTSTDELVRPDVKPAKVDSSGSSTTSSSDVEKFLKSSPELLQKGTVLYTAQCTACHGISGKGDGPAAVALNPKPRDFTSGYWNLGGAPSQVFKTLSEGSPGTSMPPFSGLSVEDRFALVHYIRSLSPNAPEETPETLAKSGVGGGAASDKPIPTIPVALAMELVAVKEPSIAITETPTSIKEPEGFQARCASCHGVEGKGGIPIRRVGVQPFAYLKTKPFSTSDAWYSDRSVFVRIVSEGLPGRGMPGMASFSQSEWETLFQTTRGLAH